jgi:hypothetical protein
LPDRQPDAPIGARSSPHWGWWVAFATIGVGLLAVGADSVLHFRDAPMDGPFQLFNALRRLAAGQHFGGTFQFFHGPGIPYLHLLPFYLFGGSFLASEMARQMVSIVAALAVLAVFFRVWTGSWREGLPWAVAGLFAMIALGINALLFPVNSMIGLRSTMPLLVAAHWYARPPGMRTTIERAALIALAIMLGIEQGMATIGALVVVESLHFLRCRNAVGFGRALAALPIAAVLFVLILVAMTPTGVASVLRYNFVSLPGDQFWYFGAPPNRFLFHWSQLAVLLVHPVWTFGVIGMVGWTLARYWRGARNPQTRVTEAEAFLAVYAALSTASMLGVLTPVYFQPAVRVALILVLIAVRREWPKRKHLVQHEGFRRRAPLYGTLAVVAYAMLRSPLPMFSLIYAPAHLAYAHGLHREPPVLDDDWQGFFQLGQSVLDTRRAELGREPVLWSTYASYLEWQRGQFHPSFDYIIHALGPENRSAYATSFQALKPDVVQTIEPTYTMYEEWLETNHWDFYRPLLRDYALVAGGPWSFFWFRRNASFDERPQLVAETPVPTGQLGIALDGRAVPKDSIGLFEVTLHYHVVNPWRRVPVIGSLPRYLVTIGGAANHAPISLSPLVTTRVFPVLTVGPNEIRLLGEVRSLVGGASLVFDSIRVERLAIAPENRQWAVNFVTGPRPKAP